MEAAPTNIKLLVIDIDGTLLNPEGNITPYTLATVQAAQQAGIIVTLATARRYCNTVQIATELGIACPLILYDGALIVQHPSAPLHPVCTLTLSGGQVIGGEVMTGNSRQPASLLHSHRLQADIAQQAVDLLVRHEIQPVVHPFFGLTEEIWTGPAQLDDLWITAYFATYPEQMRRMPYESLCTGHPDPLRVVTFASEESIQNLIPEVSALKCSWTTIKRGSYGSAEIVIMNSTCSKASGVAALAHSLDIPLQEVMALGDNNNDIQMLQAVGWGIAMGQASDAVKTAARTVTASNAEDGVAQAIERYALRCATHASSNSLRRATWR